MASTYPRERMKRSSQSGPRAERKAPAARLHASAASRVSASRFWKRRKPASAGASRAQSQKRRQRRIRLRKAGASLGMDRAEEMVWWWRFGGEGRGGEGDRKMTSLRSWRRRGGMGAERGQGLESQRVLLGFEGWKPWRMMEKVTRVSVLEPAVWSALRRMDLVEEFARVSVRDGSDGGQSVENGRFVSHDHMLSICFSLFCYLYSPESSGRRREEKMI